MITYWLPISLNKAIELGFGDLRKYHDYPLFLKLKKNGEPDKRLFLAIGCHDIPKNGVIVLSSNL